MLYLRIQRVLVPSYTGWVPISMNHDYWFWILRSRPLLYGVGSDSETNKYSRKSAEFSSPLIRGGFRLSITDALGSGLISSRPLLYGVGSDSITDLKSVIALARFSSPLIRGGFRLLSY